MSDEWKYGPKSALCAKASQPARYEENEPFLRPMAPDLLFRPSASAPTGVSAYGQRLTHRQAASMRPAQQEPRLAAFDAYGHGYAPSGYAIVPQAVYYPQPGCMLYQAPVGGYYAGVSSGVACPYSDPCAYGQSPYGVYPPCGGQPPMGMPGYPPPYAPMPYPQAAPPPMQTPLPNQAVQQRTDAPASPRQRRPMPPPAVEAVPKQAVLQTFPPASMPEPTPPSSEEGYPEQALAEARPFQFPPAAELVLPRAEAQALPVEPWVAVPMELEGPELREDIGDVAHAEFLV